MHAAGDWIDHFRGLEGLEPEVRRDLAAAARIMRVAKGTRVITPGETPHSYLLVLDGDIRISQVSDSGREIVLYRVQSGESCVLTTACLLSHEPYAAEGIAETDVTAVGLPRGTFDEQMARSAVFRQFVLVTFSHRITDLFKLVDEIAFQRLDVRLAHKILELAGARDELDITHQQLATELGTAREVISRHVHELQRRGLIAPGRGSLTIVDRAALSRLAREA
jgi:CRP/FNR family transcriptional regulator